MNWKIWKKKKKTLEEELMELSLLERYKLITENYKLILRERELEITEEETVSIASKLNKTRLGFPYESVDFFKSKKIFYPRGTPESEVNKLRAEARDICWQDIHDEEWELIKAHGKEDQFKTDWMRIQELRKSEAELEAVKALERQQALEESLKEEVIPDDLDGEIPSTFEDDIIIQDELPENHGAGSKLDVKGVGGRYEEPSKNIVSEIIGEMPTDKIGSRNVEKMIRNTKHIKQELRKKKRKMTTLDDLKAESRQIIDDEFGEPDEADGEYITQNDLDDLDIDLGV